MDKKIKEKGKIPYPESGAAQSVLWTDIPLHAEEVHSAETVVKERRNKRETFTTHAEVYSPRDFGVKKAQRSGHREKRSKSRTREQMLISEQSCHRGRRHISRARNSETEDSDQSQFLKNRDNTTGAKYRDLDHNYHLRKRYCSESEEQLSSYLRSRHIFETGGEEPINLSQAHLTECRKHIKSDVKQSHQEHHLKKNLTDATDRLFSPKHSGNTSTTGKNMKGHKLECGIQNQHFKQKDEVVETRREQRPFRDSSPFREKDISKNISINSNSLRQDCHTENIKLTNVKGDRLDPKDNRKRGSHTTFKIGDQSGNPRFHHRKGHVSEVGEGEIETTFSEILSPASCSDIIPIITETEATVTVQFDLLSRRWKEVKERIGEWWKDSLLYRNLKKYSFFYVITSIVGLICIVLSTRVSVDIMDIPLSISMVCFVCCVATFICERGCLLAFMEYKTSLEETVPDHDHRFNYRLCSDCCTKQISPAQQRSRRHRSEANTAFEHEIADVSQISAMECPQMRFVDNEDFDSSVSQNDSSKSFKIAAIVHLPETEDESSEHVYVCKHHGQNSNCGCSGHVKELDITTTKTKVIDVTLAPARNKYYSVSDHDKEDECADAFELDDDKSDETDALLGNTSDDVSTSIYDNDSLSVYTSDVSSSIYESNEASELEHAPLLVKKEIQRPQSYLSSSGDDNDAFISTVTHQSEIFAKSDPTQQEKTDSELSHQTSVRNNATEWGGNSQNVPKDASHVKKSDACCSVAQASSYHTSICENCGKDVVVLTFSLDGVETTRKVDHECEKRVRTVKSTLPPRRKESKVNPQRFSSDDDVYICEHFGQAVACACAEIILKSKSNTK